MKKMLSLVMGLVLLAGMLNVPVYAAEDKIQVTDEISVSADYDWTRFKGEGAYLNVYNWGLYISDGSNESVDVISAFEELTGIKVNYTTFDTNESMYAKLKGGGANYDLIFPSDYMIGKMMNEGMLLPLNKENIPNLANIGPEYLDKVYDPGNVYSVPYTWGTVGITYNKEMVDEADLAQSWELLWNMPVRSCSSTSAGTASPLR